MGEALSVHYSGGDSLSEDIAEWLEGNGIRGTDNGQQREAKRRWSGSLRMPGQMEQKKGAAYEIYKTGKFGVERIPYLHGMHGVWRCGKRTAFVDA